jgi:four helix bundle protein
MAGVKSLDELRAWQLALKFKRAVYALIDAGVFATDFKLEGQLREASRSAASQIAEGFGRFNPGDNTRFVNMARASLVECRNHLLDAVDRRLITEEARMTHDQLATEALREIGGLLDYLQSPEAAENAKRIKARRIARRELRTQNPNRNANKNPNKNPEPGTGNSEPQD